MLAKEVDCGAFNINGEWVQMVEVFCPVCGGDRLEAITIVKGDVHMDGGYECCKCGQQFDTKKE